MRYLFAILCFLAGFTDGIFNYAWGGGIEGQVLRVVSDRNVVPVADVDLMVFEDVPGLPLCTKLTPETKAYYVTTESNGTFSIGALKAGLYQVCGEYDYESDPDSGRIITVSLDKRVRVSRKGVTKVIYKK